MAEKIKIVFLGTSDSVPSAKRNHPAIWISYKGEKILVDCGEGTQRQIYKARLNPCKITRILITHWHADHVLGLIGLIKTLELRGYNKTLYIYGPAGIKKKIHSFLNLFGFRKSYKIIVKQASGKFFETSDFYLEAEKMTHRIPCNAYSFVEKEKIRIDKNKLKKHKISTGPHLKKLKQGKGIKYKGKKYSAKSLTYQEPGRKISIVLDTSLNKKITPFVKNANVLICESTFISKFKDKAKEYNHLTSKQAAEIAKKAKANKLFLIHVSQRYSKIQKQVLQEAKKTFKNSHMPKDLDKIEL